MGLLNVFNTTEEKESTPERKKKILVAEDDLDLRDFYRELFTQKGYDVATAVNGQEALDMIASNIPDLLILDIMMPVMNGNTVLRKLRDNEQTANLPVIVLTNAGNLDNMDNAKFFSAYKFFVKCNVAPEELLKAADEAIRFNKTNREEKVLVTP